MSDKDERMNKENPEPQENRDKEGASKEEKQTYVTPKTLRDDTLNAQEELCKNLKHYRRKRGYTQAQLAEQLKVSPVYVSQMERNLCKIPAYMVCEYSRVLNVATDSLFGLTMPEEYRDKVKTIQREVHSLPDDVLDAIIAVIESYQNK